MKEGNAHSFHLVQCAQPHNMGISLTKTEQPFQAYTSRDPQEGTDADSENY